MSTLQAKFSIRLVAASILLTATTLVHAADATWKAAPVDGAWENTNNWVELDAPGSTSGTTSTDTATFNANSSVKTIVPDANRNIKSIVFDTSSAAAYIIGTTGGNALLLSDGGAIQMKSAVNNTETINAPLLLQGSYAFTNDATSSSRLLNFGGAISGTAASGSTTTLTIAGSNTGANTLSGIVGDGANGGKLALGKSGAGTWVLGGANTFSGGTTLSEGTLHLNNASAIGTGLLTIGGGKLMNSSGAAKTLSTANAQVWNGDFAFAGKTTNADPKAPWDLNLGTGPVLLTGTRTITATGYSYPSGAWNWARVILTVGGIISDGGQGYGIVKNGDAQLNLTGVNTFSGGVTLNAGTLFIGNALAIGTGPLTINGGVVRNDALITLTANNPHYWNGSFTIVYPMSKQLNIGTGGVTLGNDVTITCGANAWGSLWGVPSVIGEVGGAHSITIASGGDNPGGLYFTAANTYSGGTVLNGATIRIGHTQALGTGPLTINGGGISQNSGNALTGISSQTWNGNFSASGTAGAINLGTSPVALPTAVKISIDNGPLTVGGNVSGAGSLTIAGTGYSSSMNLGGTNDFSGGVTLQPGSATLTLYLGNPTALGTGAFTINRGSGGAARFDSGAASVTAISNNVAQNWNANFTYVGSRSLDMGTGAVTLGTNITATVSANTLAIGGSIGNGAEPYQFKLTKAGAGTLALAGANSYTGGTVVATGTLSVESTGSLGTGAVTVAPGATLVLKNGEAIAGDAVVTLQNTGASYGKMNLSEGVVERVGSVVLGETTYTTPGMMFDAASFPSYFLGTGVLRITAPVTTVVIVK